MNWQNGGMMSLTNDAAMTARATDLADTIGNLQPDFGGLCNYQESIRLITAALCAVRDETREECARVADNYGEHSQLCVDTALNYGERFRGEVQAAVNIAAHIRSRAGEKDL